MSSRRLSVVLALGGISVCSAVGYAAYTTLTTPPVTPMYQPVSAVDGNSDLHILYGGTGYGQKLSVVKYDRLTSGRSYVGPTTFGPNGLILSYVYQIQGSTHYIGLNHATSGSGGVLTLSGSDRVYAGNPGFFTGNQELFDLKIGPDGRPYVVIREYAGGQFRGNVFVLSGNVWTQLGSGPTPLFGNEISPGFVTDMITNPGLVVVDSLTVDNGSCDIDYFGTPLEDIVDCENNGGIWTSELTTLNGSIPVVVYDVSSTVYARYFDGNSRKFLGGGYVSVLNPPLTNIGSRSGGPQTTSINIDGSNGLKVVFSDPDNGYVSTIKSWNDSKRDTFGSYSPEGRGYNPDTNDYEVVGGGIGDFQRIINGNLVAVCTYTCSGIYTSDNGYLSGTESISSFDSIVPPYGFDNYGNVYIPLSDGTVFHLIGSTPPSGGPTANCFLVTPTVPGVLGTPALCTAWTGAQFGTTAAYGSVVGLDLLYKNTTANPLVNQIFGRFISLGTILADYQTRNTQTFYFKVFKSDPEGRWIVLP